MLSALHRNCGEESEALSRELADELQVPLQIGIGLHVGTAVVV
jgi:class 3 adenylate cyclase